MRADLEHQRARLEALYLAEDWTDASLRGLHLLRGLMVCRGSVALGPDPNPRPDEFVPID